ncbi:MAG: SH3-like domain-containing protein [Acidimicrobiales bacterium]
MTYRRTDRVTVQADVAGGNPRTPKYLRGRTGQVLQAHGEVVNPLDHREVYPPLYTVLFELDGGDEVAADLHEEWLRPA